MIFCLYLTSLMLKMLWNNATVSGKGPQLYKLEQELTRGKSTANPTQTVDGNVV